MTTRYHPNFHRGIDGNKLQVGKNLLIEVDDSPLYIIGRLFKGQSFLKKLIQIEQTGSRQNPQTDQIIFEMKERSRGETKSMSSGKYTVSVYAYFSGLGGKRWKDKFEIV